MFQRVFFGPITHEENKGLKDLNGRELAYLLPLVFLCFWIGIYPKPFFQILEKPVNYIVAKVDPSLATGIAEGSSAPAGTPADMTAAPAPTPEVK
jgi:NADH-quinone oxidoreductase subunit M